MKKKQSQPQSKTGGMRYPESTAGALDSILRTTAAESARQQRAFIVSVGAVWCKPCHTLDRAVRLPTLQTVFENVNVLPIDFDIWNPQFAKSGLPLNMTLPQLVCMDPSGRPSGISWSNTVGVPYFAPARDSTQQRKIDEADQKFADDVAPSLATFVDQCQQQKKKSS